MKEARIILAGADENSVNRYLRLIAKRFGGFTAWAAHGGWVNDNGELVQEPVRVVDVALGNGLYDMAYLRGLAKAWREWADQDCVYVRDPQGNVTLI